MSLIKWFRKNTKKLIAIIVVGLMISFVMGTFLQELARRRRPMNKVVAYFGENQEIRQKHLAISAQSELSILRVLRADQVLRAQQDLQAHLLEQLLFYEPRTAAALSQQFKASIGQTRLRISANQIDEFFEQRARKAAPAELYWLLLRAEAARAGIAVSLDQAKRALTVLIPRLMGGYSYSQVVGSMVNRGSIPEEDILRVFGDLLAVLEYSQTITSNENVTARQLMHTVKADKEKLEAEFVRFGASVFAAQQAEPSDEELVRHFEQYKSFFAGQTAKDNPYGFGYKLPEMAQLEYVVIKLEDVAGLVKPPGEEEKEEYYQTNIRKFTYEEPLDPNDPDSQKMERTRSYAEVAEHIDQSLRQSRINTKVQMMLNELKDLAEAGFENIELDQMDSEKFEQLAGDYADAAKKVSEKYDIKIYTGQTDLLSAEDFLGDEHLSRLLIVGRGKAVSSLGRVVFAVEELGSSRLGPFDVPKPRMYENIGPVQDSTGQIVALVRIIDAQEPAEPNDINQIYNKKTLVLGEEPWQSEKVYSVKEIVAEDIKLLKAMETAESRAQEFVRLAQTDEWDNIIEKFNERYGGPTDPNDYTAKPFRRESHPGMQKISNVVLRTEALHYAGNPLARTLISNLEKRKKFVDRLYSLLPPEKESVENLPLMVEFKPDKSFYVIKSLYRKLVTGPDYEKAKAAAALTEDGIAAGSLALAHFSPENIEKRMNFRPAGTKTQRPKSDEQTTTTSGEL